MKHIERSQISYVALEYKNVDREEMECFIMKQLLHRMIDRLTLSDLPKEFKFTMVDPRKEDINKADIMRQEYLNELMRKGVVEFNLEYNQKQ